MSSTRILRVGARRSSRHARTPAVGASEADARTPTRSIKPPAVRASKVLSVLSSGDTSSRAECQLRKGVVQALSIMGRAPPVVKAETRSAIAPVAPTPRDNGRRTGRLDRPFTLPRRGQRRVRLRLSRFGYLGVAEQMAKLSAWASVPSGQRTWISTHNSLPIDRLGSSGEERSLDLLVLARKLRKSSPRARRKRDAIPVGRSNTLRACVGPGSDPRQRLRSSTAARIDHNVFTRMRTHLWGCSTTRILFCGHLTASISGFTKSPGNDQARWDLDSFEALHPFNGVRPLPVRLSQGALRHEEEVA